MKRQVGALMASLVSGVVLSVAPTACRLAKRPPVAVTASQPRPGSIESLRSAIEGEIPIASITCPDGTPHWEFWFFGQTARSEAEVRSLLNALGHDWATGMPVMVVCESNVTVSALDRYLEVLFANGFHRVWIQQRVLGVMNAPVTAADAYQFRRDEPRNGTRPEEYLVPPVP